MTAAVKTKATASWRVECQVADSPVITAIDTFAYWPEGGLKPQLLVRIQTTDGITGWGESGFTFRERAVAEAVTHLRDLVVGRRAFDISTIWQELYRRAYFEGCRVTSAAMSAIDVALHDIKGRALGVPVHQLLGGLYREQIGCFATTSGRTRDAMRDSAVALKAMGYDSIRLHVLPEPTEGLVFDPWTAVAETARAVVDVREAIGPDVFLGLDFHHRLSPAQTVSFCNRIPSGSLDFLEEPIRAENPSAYRRLSEKTSMPLAVGEEFTSKWAFRQMIEDNVLGYARIDLANVGGFTEAMKIAAWCEAHYIDVMPHNPLGPVNTAATLQFAAVLPNFAVLEARAHQVHAPLSVDAHIYPDQPVLRETRFEVSRTPGLGLSIDQDALDEECGRYRTGHPQRLVRPDGSFTNA